MKNTLKTIVIATLAILLTLTITRQLEKVNAQSSSPPSLDSEVSVDSGNSYGSTGVKIRRFSNVAVNVGSDITYTDSATDGASFTINANGVYAISYTDGNCCSDNMGISLNASTTTDLASIGVNRLCLTTIANTGASCSVILILGSGDVIRAHRTNGGSLYSDTNTVAKFIITRLR